MNDATAKPPVAAKKPNSFTHHGVTIEDPYFWLRDPGYPKVEDAEVLAHLKAENAWFEARMAPHRPLVETLFQEMKGRIKEADASVPEKDGDWLYWIEFEEGAQYKKWWRRPVGTTAADGKDELILDETALAAGHEYFRLGALSVSPSGRLLAYSTDTDGSERYTIRFRRLGAAAGTLADEVTDAAGNEPDSEVPGTIGNIVWSAAEDAVLYSLSDENWRHRTIKLHRLGSDPASDVVTYHDPDEAFSCSVSLGAQEKWIILQAGDHETSEVRLIPAADPLAELADGEPGREQDQPLDEQPDFGAVAQVAEVEVRQGDDQRERGRVDERVRATPEGALDEDQREHDQREIADPGLEDAAPFAGLRVVGRLGDGHGEAGNGSDPGPEPGHRPTSTGGRVVAAARFDQPEDAEERREAKPPRR